MIFCAAKKLLTNPDISNRTPLTALTRMGSTFFLSDLVRIFLKPEGPLKRLRPFSKFLWIWFILKLLLTSLCDPLFLCGIKHKIFLWFFTWHQNYSPVFQNFMNIFNPRHFCFDWNNNFSKSKRTDNLICCVNSSVIMKKPIFLGLKVLWSKVNVSRISVLSITPDDTLSRRRNNLLFIN